MKTLDQCYEAYAPEIYRYIYSLCYNRELAEDIMQETFYKAYSQLESIQNEAIRSWLFRIAHNAFLDYIKKEKRSFPKELDFFQDQLKEASFEKQLLEKERFQEVLQAVDALPFQQKQALLLWSVHQLSYREIAAIIHLSESSVKSLIFRARAKLKKERGNQNE